MSTPFSIDTLMGTGSVSPVGSMLDTRTPVIGITANYADGTAKLAQAYYEMVERAGGLPLILPPSAHQAETIVHNHIDGLLLTGGADINPLFMGQEPLPGLGAVNDVRDRAELLTARLAFNHQMPVLGICRGIQVMAVALGGQVCQDMDHPGRLKHSQDADRHVPTHTATIAPGTELHRLYAEADDTDGPLNIYVNSFHHQAVSDPGPHLRVSATATDGVIEAVESSESKPFLGVQWHPECMRHLDGIPPFKWLVEQARQYRELRQLHQRLLTLDTHCDTPMHFTPGFDPFVRHNDVLVDIPKMLEGGLDASIMVAYIPQAMAQQPQSPKAYADQIFDRIEEFAKYHLAPRALALARTPQQLWENKAAGKRSIVLGIENGLALEGDLANVEHFARRGVVYITLCHNGDNDICGSAAPTLGQGGERLVPDGVSSFGEKVIGEMNRLGLMVDLSHASEKSFFDALDLSATPIVCSHSSCRALCDHPRNLTDEQLRRLARRGGVCQITLYPGFLTSQGEATIHHAMAHLEHAIKVAGIDHVGLGTDFDGDGGVRGLASASEALLFTRQLLKRRFSEADIQRIWGGNFLRVMQQAQNSAQAKTL